MSSLLNYHAFSPCYIFIVSNISIDMLQYGKAYRNIHYIRKKFFTYIFKKMLIRQGIVITTHEQSFIKVCRVFTIILCNSYSVVYTFFVQKKTILTNVWEFVYAVPLIVCCVQVLTAKLVHKMFSTRVQFLYFDACNMRGTDRVERSSTFCFTCIEIIYVFSLLNFDDLTLNSNKTFNILTFKHSFSNSFSPCNTMKNKLKEHFKKFLSRFIYTTSIVFLFIS